MQSWVFSVGLVHLNNLAGRPSPGGDPRNPLTTPFSVSPGWPGPTVAAPKPLWQGGAPLANGAQALAESYENVEESIPIEVSGLDADNVAQSLQLLKRQLSGASFSAPTIWRHRSVGGSNEVYAEIYSGWVQEETTTDDEITAVEGWADVAATLHIVRSPFFGAYELFRSLDGASVTSGDSVSLGDLLGDLQDEGEPLVIELAKPTSGTASGVVLATVASHAALTVADSLAGVTSTTTGSAFAATSAVDIGALRRLARAEVRVLAALSSLTNPTTAEVQAEIQTAGGSVLWTSAWVPLDSATTGQLVDLGGAPLTGVRLPLAISTALNVVVVVRLRSTDGTAVSATLDAIDLLLAHDVCAVSCSGLGSGEVLRLYGAQNLSGGGWLPLASEAGGVFDASDVQIGPARIRGQLIRAFADASVYVAWTGSGGAYSRSDSSTLTVDVAPLWRSLRGVT